MGSRKHRRERDGGPSSRKHKRRTRSRSFSISKSRSRTRSRSPISAPPPPTLSSHSSHSNDRSRDDSERRHHRKRKEQKDIRERREHKEHKRSKHSRDDDRKRSNDNRGSSKNERDYHSDSSDVVEVPLPPPAPVISKRTKSPSPIPENGAGDVLSIAETNKLRAKLGLKPLEIDPKPSEQSSSSSSAPPAKEAEGHSKHKDEWGEFYHKPADNFAEKVQTEKLREKFRQRKEKRAIEEKLKRIRTLGEDDEIDDTSAWIERSREKEKAKEEAARRAKILEEMDDEFGVGELVKRETRKERHRMYNDNHLKGLRVDHDMDAFSEGKTVILTLKDHDVLDEENGDTLVNVNMVDDERYRKSNENKKLKPNHYGYDVYQDEVDQFGNPIDRNVLSKYDDEIDGATKKASFKIGENIEEEREHRRRLLEIKTKLSGKRLETLNEPLTSLASDTYTESELATFKKPKKKVKKLRKKLRAEDLEPLPSHAGESSRDFAKRDARRHLDDVLDTDDTPDVHTDDVKVEEDDNELEQMLSKARRLKQSEALIKKTLSFDPTKIKPEIKSERNSDNEDADNGHDNFMTLNSTAEFCRTLGDIPTYGMSGNRDLDTNDMMDLEDDAEDNEEQMEEEPTTGTWNSVNPDSEMAPIDAQLEVAEVAILDEEPDVGSGMGAALKLALSKGYLEKEESNRPSNTRMAHLQAKNYSIEDKTHGDDDKFNRRDRFHTGPLSEFKEKESYKPNVKLEYIDDNGHLLNEKEAFRYLSHKFHGKGPGKNKIEKRLKKNEQDGLMKKMSSTDTPLGTLTMLQHKQKETHSPYIVLSGSKQMQGSTSITKHK